MNTRTRFLDAAHRTFARRPLLLRLAIKIRNQCQAIVAKSVSAGTASSLNGEAWLVSRVASGVSSFVDVGANRGNWSRMLLASAPTAVGLAIDPSPSSCAELKGLFRGDPRVTVLQLAISDRSGSASFFDPGAASELASLVPGIQQGLVGQPVRVVTLDQLVGDRGIKAVDFLKIDTEGFDLRVLQGATSLLREERIRTIQFEYNWQWAKAGSTLSYAVQFLEGFGYSTWLLTSHGLARPPLESLGEYFAYSNYVALSNASRGDWSDLP